jgi:hypothetical protein
LVSQRRQGGGDGLEVGFDVGGGGGAGVVSVAGVGAGDAVAEVAFDPGQGGVPQPVDGDALGGGPGRPLSEAGPEVVVAAGGQWPAGAVAQQLILLCAGAAEPGVVEQMGGQFQADRLPAQRLAFLA